MFKRILVPLDLSPNYRRAVETAAELAQQGGAEVTLFHVIETIAGVAVEEERNFYNRLEASAHTHLERAGDILKACRVHGRREVRLGHRAQEVLRFATEQSADLIVLSAPRIEPGHPETGWGSLSYKIGILAQCPILLVK